MEPLKNFLESNPSETIIMSIKDEEDPLDIGRLERDFIKNSAYKFYQYQVSSWTRLGAVRGKIVLFRRYSGGQSIGTRWEYNMAIQDDYSLDAECTDIEVLGVHIKRVCSPVIGLDYPKKARKVVNFLKHAAREIVNDQFNVNFASANWNGLFVHSSALVSNKAILKFFKDHPKTIVGSIIAMDYPNRVSGLIEAIISNNFNRNEPESILRGSKYNGYFGDWGVPAFCPPGHFVFGYRLRSESKQGSDGDDTALNDVELRCALKGNVGVYTTIYSSYLTWGIWGDYRYCSGSDNPVIGYDMLIEPKQGSGHDDTAANDVDLYCKKGKGQHFGYSKYAHIIKIFKALSLFFIFHNSFKFLILSRWIYLCTSPNIMGKFDSQKPLSEWTSRCWNSNTSGGETRSRIGRYRIEWRLVVL